ncbi:MAG TPA: MBG domain-containing protein [Symbiobacteriaceae bacterium]|nr:MBG domain-containing protein [Symbiobacteriaceae bacterium]
MGVRSRLALLVGPLIVALAFLLPGRGEAIPVPGPGDPGGGVTTILTIEPVIGTYGDTVTVVAYLKDADTDAGVPDQTVNFLFHGQFLPATTDAAGRAVLERLPLERPGLGRLAAGWYPGDVEATYDGVSGSFARSTGVTDLIVDPRALKVIPDSVTREYGDPNPAAFSYRLENFLEGDGPEVLTSAPVCTTPATVESGAGTYAIECDGLAAANYTADYSTTGILTVTPAPMIIRADDQSRLYGQANPVLTASYIGTWKLADGPGSLKGTLKCSSQNGGIKWASVGDYEIICTGQSATNYSLKYVAGTLRVGPAPLRVDVGTYTRPYGQPDPKFTVAGLAGFVNGETADVVTGSLLCTVPGGTAAPAGAYTPDCGGLKAPNYTMVYSGELTVLPVPLTVTAEDKNRLYRAPNPPLTVRYGGFVGSDGPGVLTGTLSCTTPAGAASQPGKYPITCTGLSAVNYTISYVDGTLLVNPRPPRDDTGRSPVPPPPAPAPAPAPAPPVKNPAPVIAAPMTAPQPPRLVAIDGPFGPGAGNFRVYVDQAGRSLRMTLTSVALVYASGDRITVVGTALVEDVTEAARPKVLEAVASLRLAWAPGGVNLTLAGAHMNLEVR